MKIPATERKVTINETAEYTMLLENITPNADTIKTKDIIAKNNV